MASHALTSSIGKGMAGNVATFCGTAKVSLQSRSKTMNTNTNTSTTPNVAPLADKIRALYTKRASALCFAKLAEFHSAFEWNKANEAVRAELGLAPLGLLHAEKVELRRIAAAYSSHAAEQAEWFISACEADSADWFQYGANPDLVAALGHQTAPAWLGWG
jgi:hypothetical protein